METLRTAIAPSLYCKLSKLCNHSYDCYLSSVSLRISQTHKTTGAFLDTHGLLHPEAVAASRWSDLIVRVGNKPVRETVQNFV